MSYFTRSMLASAVAIATCGIALTTGLTSSVNARSIQTNNARRNDDRITTQIVSQELFANLSGAAQVPAVNTRGRGRISLTVKPRQNQVCYQLFVTGIAHPTEAHIHQGRIGSNGPVVLDLNLPTPRSHGCIAADPTLVQNLLRHPGNYYANIHDTQFPEGAIRGNLRR